MALRTELLAHLSASVIDPETRKKIPKLIASLIEDTAAYYRFSEAALGAVPTAVIITDGRGTIEFVNQAALALDQTVVAIQRGQKLTLHERHDSRRLLALIATVAHGGTGGVVRINDQAGRTALLAMVSPLIGQLLPDAAGGPFVLTTLEQPFGGARLQSETLQQAFGLTRVQAAIAIAVFDGRSVEEIAAERATKISTIRTHLAEIFARTRTDNQRELTRLIASFRMLGAMSRRDKKALAEG